jgi:rsbT co-antagonist protein RsbR
MAEEPRMPSVPAERLDRLRRAATLAAEGEFEDALALLGDPPRDEVGEVERSVCALITDFKLATVQSALAIEDFQASKQELLQKIDTIERQQTEIKQLSAPLIDVWEGVVAVPLIGPLSGSSTKDLGRRLLARIEQTSITWVILDLTGADSMDAITAAGLVRLANAVRLMGAECLLTGMRASMADALVSLETSLVDIQTRTSLEEGLKHCLRVGAARASLDEEPVSSQPPGRVRPHPRS